MTPDRFQATLAEVGPLAEAFVAAGHRLYLVGGIVRDRFLGLEATPGDDIDLTTDARPDEILRLVRPLADATWEQGARFGTIGCRIGGRAFEITTHRAEAYASDSRKPVVDYSDDVEADLARRDFTVNAMALEVPEPRLVDPFDGAADLAAGRLRTPLAPEVSFSDDPLRMLRLFRFVSQLGFTPDDETVAAVTAMRETVIAADKFQDTCDTPVHLELHQASTTAALAGALGEIMHLQPVAAVAVFTVSGTTARLIAKNRPPCPIVALSASVSTLRRCCLYHGVMPHPVETPRDTVGAVQLATRVCAQLKLAQPGERIIILAGHPFDVPGNTNGLVVVTLE